MLDAVAQSVAEEVEAFQRTRPDAWNIPRDEAMILHNLVLIGGCRCLVEVGTSYGYSGLFLAAAVRANGGILHTFERNEAKLRQAREYFERAGLSKTVRLHRGDARRELARFDRQVDFAFLDATKVETREYFDLLEGHLAPRCVLTVDNTSTHPEELAEFLSSLRGREDFSCCHVPVGNGFELAFRPGEAT